MSRSALSLLPDKRSPPGYTVNVLRLYQLEGQVKMIHTLLYSIYLHVVKTFLTHEFKNHKEFQSLVELLRFSRLLYGQFVAVLVQSVCDRTSCIDRYWHHEVIRCTTQSVVATVP